MKARDLLKKKREEAVARRFERDSRGDAGQLLYLEERGFGHCKEAQGLRAKLSGGEVGPIVGTLHKETEQ